MLTRASSDDEGLKDGAERMANAEDVTDEAPAVLAHTSQKPSPRSRC